MPVHKPSASSSSSSCPSISTTRPNPNARNSESKDPMRRSFSGNPFVKPSSIVANPRGGFNPNTPANSPSDPRRSSIGREKFSLGDSEDKENSKSSGLRPERVQSPASASKGTKNFMSPTISAASKFNPSPRKKILVERNELRSSGSFSEAKSQVMMEDNSVKPEISLIKKKTVSFSDAITMLMEDDLSKPELDLNKKKIEVSHDSTVTDMDHLEAPKSYPHFDSDIPLNLENDVGSLWETVTEKDCFNLDPSFKISPRSPSSPTLAPLDADPVMPPRSTSSPMLALLDSDPVMPPRSTSSPMLALLDSDPVMPPSSTSSPMLAPMEANPLMPPRSTSSPMLAPLDADPLMPPYDPKTNYLSPRPQFLHYKPNPRVELILNERRDGKRLEESFILENLSDSEVSERLSEDSQKESDDDSSDEIWNEEEGKEEPLEEEELNVSEPVPMSTHKPKESVQEKEVSKSKFFTRSKYIALFLVLAFAWLSISVTDSPVSNLSVLNDLSHYDLYVPPEITELAKANFEELAQKSRLWAANSLSYICKLFSELGVHRLGPVQYGNLTAVLEEDSLVDGYLKFGHRGAVTDLKYEENVLTPLRERDVKVESLKDSHQEIEADDKDNEEILEEDNTAGFEEQVPQDVESESEEVFTPSEEVIEPANLVAEQSEDATEVTDVKYDIKPPSTIDITDQPAVIVPEVAEIQPEVYEASEAQEENYLDSCAEIESTKAEEILQITEMDASVVSPQSSATLGKFLTKNVVAISSLVLLSLLTGTAFFNYAKKGKLSSQNATTRLKQSGTTKKLDYSPISVATENTFQLKPTSKNWQTEVDDMYGEPCPSEMSSFNSSSHSKKGIKATSSEAQSQETMPRRNYRRESLASSDFSLGSASYGSFTTYEKIPSKHVCGEDEVVTPVRRSSRIRNLVTSP